jgi:hypothetical protein
MAQFRASQFTARQVPAAIIAIVFGLEFPDPQLMGGPSPLPNDHTMIFAANEAPSVQAEIQTDENADTSAKMGNESGASGAATAPGDNSKK